MNNRASREMLHQAARQNYRRRTGQGSERTGSTGRPVQMGSSSAAVAIRQDRREPEIAAQGRRALGTSAEERRSSGTIVQGRRTPRMTAQDRRRRVIRRKRQQQARVYRVAALLFVCVVLYLAFSGTAAILSFIENSRATQRGSIETVAETAGVDAVMELQTAQETAAEAVSGAESTGTKTAETGSAESTEGMVQSGGRWLDPSKPMIALTFDDGPDSQIDQILMEELEKANGRSTFFVVGNRIAKNTEIVKKMLANGHEIGNHSWDHDLKLSTKGEQYIREEFSKTEDALRQLTGTEPALIRLPGGLYTEAVGKTVKKPMIYWSIDTEDWKSKNADSVIERTMKDIRDGDIVLMHSLYMSTAEACRKMIPELSQRGFQLVTVSELIRLRGASAEGGNGKQYRSFRPQTPAESKAGTESGGAQSVPQSTEPVRETERPSQSAAGQESTAVRQSKEAGPGRTETKSIQAPAQSSIGPGHTERGEEILPAPSEGTIEPGEEIIDAPDAGEPMQ